MLNLRKTTLSPVAPALPRVDDHPRVKAARLMLADMETEIARAVAEDDALRAEQDAYGAHAGPGVLMRARALLDGDSDPERHAERRRVVARRLAILRGALNDQRRLIAAAIAAASAESRPAIRDLLRPLALAQRDALATYVATNSRLREARDHIVRDLGHQLPFGVPTYTRDYRADDECAAELETLLKQCTQDAERI